MMTSNAHGTERTHNENGTRVAFVDRAMETVRRIADSVDEPRLQRALDADTDAAVLTALGLTKVSASVQSLSMDPLTAARARGEQAKRDILAAQGHMLNEAEVADRLSTDPVDVRERARNGLLISLPDERGRPAYPSWQFTDDGLLPGLEDIPCRIRVSSPWSKAAFFFSGDIHLNWRTPLLALLEGDIAAVKHAASAYGEQIPA